MKKQRIGLGSKKMINRLINELMAYGMREYLVDEDDRVYITLICISVGIIKTFISKNVEKSK